MNRRILPTLLCGMATLVMLVLLTPAPVLTAPRLPLPHSLKEKPNFEKNLAHLIPYSTKLAERYTDLQGRMAEIFQPAEVHDQLMDLSEKIEDLAWETRFLKVSGGHNYNKIPMLQAQIAKFDDEVKEIRKPVSKGLQELASWKKEWVQQKEQLPEWRKAVSKEITYSTVKKTFQNIEQTITGVLKLIAHRLKPMLAADQQIGEQQIKIHTLNAQLNELSQSMSKGGLLKKAPSMFSEAFYKQFEG